MDVQMLRTALTLIQTTLAIISAVRCVVSPGGPCSVSATTRSVTAGPTSARGPELVAQQAVDAFVHEPLLRAGE